MNDYKKGMEFGSKNYVTEGKSRLSGSVLQGKATKYRISDIEDSDLNFLSS